MNDQSSHLRTLVADVVDELLDLIDEVDREQAQWSDAMKHVHAIERARDHYAYAERTIAGMAGEPNTAALDRLRGRQCEHLGYWGKEAEFATQRLIDEVRRKSGTRG